MKKAFYLPICSIILWIILGAAFLYLELTYTDIWLEFLPLLGLFITGLVASIISVISILIQGITKSLSFRKTVFSIIVILAIPVAVCIIDYSDIAFRISISEREEFAATIFNINECTYETKQVTIKLLSESEKRLGSHEAVYICEDKKESMLYYTSLGMPDGYSAYLYTRQAAPLPTSLPDHASNIVYIEPNWYFVSGD